MADNIQKAQNFLHLWDQGAEFFEIQTSGSTGEPKTIQLSRRAMLASALSTGKALGISPTDRIHCCLPVDKIGGLMQLVRSRVWDIPLHVEEPSAIPDVCEPKGSIVSLTVMQLKGLLTHPKAANCLNQYRIVLVGGSMLDSETESLLCTMRPAFYHTYGMTETCSHVALRRLNADTHFKPLPGIEIGLTAESCITICGEVTNGIVLETRDLGEVTDSGFRILGRADDAINSGGVKIHPEQVEAFLRESFSLPDHVVAVTGVQDLQLGEQVVMLYKTGIDIPDMNAVPWPEKFWKPRLVFEVDEIPLTETGKIKRGELRGLAAFLHSEAGKKDDKP